MPTTVELLSNFQRSKKLWEIFPGHTFGPVLNYSPEGQKEHIIFGCEEDNSATLILTLKPDPDPELPEEVVFSLGMSLHNMEPEVLSFGQSRILELKKRKSGPTRLIRVTHQ
jgi:hypothetical protein